MPNVVEIEIRARDLTDASFAEVKGKAEALGGDAGRAGGKELSKGFEEESKAGFDSLFTDLSGMSAGQFERMMGPDSAMVSSAGRGGRKAGEELMKGIEDGSIAVGPPDFMLPDGRWASEVTDNARKTGEKAGQASGSGFAGGISPLIMAAFAGVAVAGPATLLAATGLAMVGVTALVLKSNDTIAYSYKTLASDAVGSIKAAAAPVTADLNQAVMTLDAGVQHLQPALTSLFAAAAPNLNVFANGLTNLVGGLLPGLTSALSKSQGIFQDFANSLGPLGSSVGQFFNNLTVNAKTTGAGLQTVFGLLGNTLSTLGTVMASTSTVISSSLMAVGPALNGILAGVNAVASPQVVGGLLGAFGAMKLDPGISTGLARGAASLADLGIKAEGSVGVLGKFSGAALGSSKALSTMSDVMGGPWGIAIGAGVGLLAGFAGALFSASHASDALLLSAQELQKAVIADGGAAGQSTAALIEHEAATSALADTLSKAGVSTVDYVKAVMGDVAAQKLVTDAVTAANQKQTEQTATTDAATHVQSKFGAELQGATSALDQHRAKTNALTDANKQLLESMAKEAAQVADTINKQTALDAATNALNKNTGVFNATLNANYQKLQATTIAQGDTAVAAMDLGDGQSALNMQLADAVSAYDLAQAGGKGYETVLSAMSGDMTNLLGTEAAVTIALGNLTTSVKTNGTSLDVNSEKGAKNTQAFVSIAGAAVKAASAVYESEFATKGATTAYNDANATLATSKARFIAAADAAGFSKDQVAALAEQLFHLPPAENISITADTGPALASLAGLLYRINTSSGTVRVYTTASGSVGSTGMAGTKAQATGGIVGAASGGARGSLTWVGEQGPELVDLPYGSTVTPNSNASSLVESGGRGIGGDGGSMQISFAGNTDSAFATAFMRLVRTGAIQIKTA